MLEPYDNPYWDFSYIMWKEDRKNNSPKMAYQSFFAGGTHFAWTNVLFLMPSQAKVILTLERFREYLILNIYLFCLLNNRKAILYF